MRKQAINTPAAPAAIGPYSQTIRTGSLVFLSGQIPLDPATGQLVSGEIETETRRVFENLKAVATAAGGSLDNAVQVAALPRGARVEMECVLAL